MRPARRWPASLTGIWLAALLAMAPPGVPMGAGRGVTVSGVVVAPDGARLQSGAAMMNPVGGDVLASAPPDDAQFFPDGSFSFGSVSPGLYQIRARAQTVKGETTLFAGYRIQVRDRDISGLRLVLRPGATVSGIVEVEAGDAAARFPGFAGLRVRAPFADGSRFGDVLTAGVQADGRFRLTSVMEGEHHFTLDGLTAPWVVQGARWRDVDVANRPLTIASGETIDGVRITIGAGGSADLTRFKWAAAR